jgi:phosphatidyl-myo-inositol dimannoside synthase
VIQVYGTETWTPRPERPDIAWGMRRCNYAISDAHFTANYVEEVGLRPKSSVWVMWDPVDIERFKPGPPDGTILAKYGIPSPDRFFNILTLGRLGTKAIYKGYVRLLEAFRKLPLHSRLIYGGGGDLRPVLETRAGELGVADRVIFAGFVREEDLPDVYRSGSVFCLVGDRGHGRGEGIPLTPLEAAACGIPILVGNQDGSREAVEQGVNGFALDPLDLDEIARQLIRLLEDENRRRDMGRAARARIEREHAYPIFRERMRSFLSQLGFKPTTAPNITQFEQAYFPEG